MSGHYFSQLPNIIVRNPLDNSPAVEKLSAGKESLCKRKTER